MRKFRSFLFGPLFPCALCIALVFGAGAVLAAWLPRALAPVAAAERLFSFAAGAYTAASPLPAESKTARLLVLLFLPWVGAVYCVFAGTRPRESAEKSLFRTDIKSAVCFPVGAEMRPAFLADLAAAKTFIFLEYYIVAEGVFWSEILRILRERAAAGVDVRLIFDGFGSALTLPKRFVKELHGYGIKTLVFGRMRFPWRSANRRDHRKIAAIDGKIAYTGGINLADEYVGKTVRFGHWKDSAVRLEGRAAAVMAQLFLRTWEARFPADGTSLPAENTEERGGIPCTVFCDGIQDRPRTGAHVLLRFFSEAQSALYLQTPYLLPDEPLAETLKAAAQAGVDVRVMIPHIPDKKTAFALTRRSARELIEAGVSVREYAAGFLHAKSAVADGKRLYIGSYNLDLRSLRLQAECGVLLGHAPLAREAERDFLSDWEAGLPVPPQTGGERALCALLLPFRSLI